MRVKPENSAIRWRRPHLRTPGYIFGQVGAGGGGVVTQGIAVTRHAVRGFWSCTALWLVISHSIVFVVLQLVTLKPLRRQWQQRVGWYGERATLA